MEGMALELGVQSNADLRGVIIVYSERGWL